MEYILNLSKSLGNLFQKEFHGFFIGKAKIEFLEQYKGGNINFESEINKDLIKYKKIISHILEDENILCKMELILIKKTSKEAKIIEKENEVVGKHFCTINNEEIFKFSKDTGDLNEIHFGEKPVVQGMLIIKYLDEYLISLKYKYIAINIRFVQPLYSGERTNIILEEKYFNVYKGDKLILKGSIE